MVAGYDVLRDWKRLGEIECLIVAPLSGSCIWISGCWVNESVAFYLGANTVVTTDPGEEPELAGCSQP